MREFPGPARGDQRHAACRARSSELLEVEALPHPVVCHAIEHDLACAAVLGLVDPLERAPAGGTLARGVARVLANAVFASVPQAVDANYDALRTEALREPPDQRWIGESGRSEERRVGKECRSRWSP